jgi:hypothetical protein
MSPENADLRVESRQRVVVRVERASESERTEIKRLRNLEKRGSASDRSGDQMRALARRLGSAWGFVGWVARMQKTGRWRRKSVLRRLAHKEEEIEMRAEIR